MRGCVLPTHLTLSRLRKVASVASPLESPEEFRGVSSSIVQTVSTTWTNKGRCSTDKKCHLHRNNVCFVARCLPHVFKTMNTFNAVSNRLQCLRILKPESKSLTMQQPKNMLLGSRKPMIP